MKAHKIETKLVENGTLILNQLPFRAGDTVEVIVLDGSEKKRSTDQYPLRNQPVVYHDPTSPVADQEWNTLNDHP